jgi:hypothetical protein
MRRMLLGLLVVVAVSLPAWARRPPVVTAYADPCRERCTFALCPVGEGSGSGPTSIVLCPGPCGQYQFSVPASEDRLPRIRIGRARVRLLCHPTLAACLFSFCHSDADCDDGDPGTVDVCSSVGSPMTYCEHLRICP